MAENKRAAGTRAGMAVDTALVRELAEMLSETGLTEIEVEDGDRRIRLSREQIVTAAASVPVAAPVAAAPVAAAPAAAPAEAAAPAVDLANAVKSPMVGTAYLSPEPGAPALIAVGDSIKAGSTLLIVEAMKVMNPITAPKDGVVKDILIGNAEPVEFDQPLVILG